MNGLLYSVQINTVGQHGQKNLFYTVKVAVLSPLFPYVHRRLQYIYSPKLSVFKDGLDVLIKNSLVSLLAVLCFLCGPAVHLSRQHPLASYSDIQTAVGHRRGSLLLQLDLLHAAHPAADLHEWHTAIQHTAGLVNITHSISFMLRNICFITVCTQMHMHSLSD